MAVTHTEAGLTPVEMLEHLILTRNLISGNIACSFDSWVQKKTRRPFKAARARELRTATIVANRRTGRIRSVAKMAPKLRPTDIVIGEVDVIIYDRHGLDVFLNMSLDVDVILTAADGTCGRRSSTIMLVNSDLSRTLFSGSYMSEMDMDLSNHSVITNCVEQAAQDWLKMRKQ